MLKSFPVSLNFSLSLTADIEQVANEIRARYSDLVWGVEDDLLKASTDWPQAILTVSDMRSHGPEYAEYPYPVTIGFLVFPGCIAGNQDVMLPTFLSILRDLSLRFECPVLGDASDHVLPEPGSYTRKDASFLMQGGVLYTCAWSPRHVTYEDAVQPGDWLPVTDLPEFELNAAGQLTDPAMVERYKTWRANRQSPPPFPPERIRALYAGTLIGEGPPEIDEDASDEDLCPWSYEPPASATFGETPANNGLSGDDMDDYFEKMDAYLAGRGATTSQRLIEEGVTLPAASEMDDETLSVKLAEMIAVLATQQTYIHSTNHLSDRELYNHLWKKSLNEVSMNLTGISGASHNIDILGGCSEEDLRMYLVHYDSPSSRALTAAQYPDQPIPAHIPPPFDRDRHLPKPPRP